MAHSRIPDWWRGGGGRLALALTLSAALFAAVLVGALLGQRSAAHHNCERINRLQTAIATILQASQAALPANRFYRNHPADLTRAEQELRRDLQLIQQARCLN